MGGIQKACETINVLLSCGKPCDPLNGVIQTFKLKDAWNGESPFSKTGSEMYKSLNKAKLKVKAEV